MLDVGRSRAGLLDRMLWGMSFQEYDMKHSKWIAALATAGGLVAMSGAAYAIAPAAALGLAALGGAAVGSAAAQAHEPPAVAVVPSNPTVVLGGPPAVVTVPADGHYEVINGATVWVQAQPGAVDYDHDNDGVLNSEDRFPNDGTRS
jgi:hypothetical protein